MLVSMLSKSFKPAKCKTSLKLAVARIKLMRNKTEVQVKMMRRELAQLLESGQDQTARIRVEHVIREEKTMSAYDLIELYCELLVARLPIIESQKSCPIDLKEAVASVVFASPRCADVPELMDIRKHFAAKYGKEFINSALEVRPDCGVSRLVVEKLSARAPDIETKVKTLKAIAQEHNVKWDSKSVEVELRKPHDDLPNGPTSFASASKMPVESSNMRPSPPPTQTNESSVKMSQNNTTSRPTSFNNFPETNTRTPRAQPNVSSINMPQNDSSVSNSSETGVPATSVPFTYYNKSRPSEHASLNRPTWSMEFQDATTAAQAAAEFAERASLAARAAAELASRGSMSRQKSTGSNESPRYNKKYEKPENLRAFLDERVDETVLKPNDELKSSQRMRTEAQNLPKDERMQRISSRETLRASNDYSTGRRPPSRSSSSLSSQGSVNDEMLNVGVHKDGYNSAQRISSYESGVVELNHLNMNHGNCESSQDNINISSRRTPSSHYVTDDEKFLNSNIYKNESYESQTFGMDTGEVSFGSNHKKSTYGNSSAVVFDDYNSEAEENNSVFGRNRVTLLDSYQEDEPSSFQSNKGPFSVDQRRNGSFAKNDGSRLHLFTESRPEEHSETMNKGSFGSQSIDSVPLAFDNSDGERTQSEDEGAYSSHKKATMPSHFLHYHRQSTRSSFSDESISQSTHIYMGETKEVKETTRNSRAYEENIERDSYAADKFHKRSSSSNLPDNQSSPRCIKAASNSNISVGGSGYSSTDEEESQTLRLTKRQPTRELEAKERSQMPSTGFTGEVSEISNELSDESGQRINYGRLTGGFKQRGFPCPPYVRSSVADASIFEKPVFADLGRQPARIEVAKNEGYNQESQPGPYALKSRTTKAPIDSQFDNAEGQDARYSTEDTPDIDEGLFASNNAKIAEALNRYNQKDRMRANKESSSRTTYLESDGSEAKLDCRKTRDVKLSRRTRDVPSVSKRSSSSVIGPHRDPAYDSVTIQGKGSFKPVQSNPSSEHPLVAPKQMPSTAEEHPKPSQLNSTGNVVPTNKENTKPSPSSETSVKKASHTHPKLPDYDSFAAHFHSLRSNER